MYLPKTWIIFSFPIHKFLMKVINFVLFQIYLLAAPPSKTVTALFRIHLNLLNGPLLAFLFPETASRTVSTIINKYCRQLYSFKASPYLIL